MKIVTFTLFSIASKFTFILPTDGFTVPRKPSWLLSSKSKSTSTMVGNKISINRQHSNCTDTSGDLHKFINDQYRLDIKLLYSTQEVGSLIKNRHNRIPFVPLDEESAPTQKMRKDSTNPIVINDSKKTDEAKLEVKKSSGQWPTKLTRSIVKKSIWRLVHRWSIKPPKNLKISSSPTGNVVGRLLFNGEVASDIRIKFESLYLRNIFISGGGCLEIKELSMNLRRFMPKKLGRFLEKVKYGPENPGRFASSFDIRMVDCIMKSHDLIRSSCVRNGLSNLFKRILNSFEFVNTSEVFIREIEILPSMKISCKGLARTEFGTNVPFEVRSSIEICGGGHVIIFPGLQISVNPYLQVFVPVPNITLDIGHNAKIENLEIDEVERQIKLSAQVTIIPSDKRKLTYKQRKSSYLAQYHYDAAAWLTRAGNFTQ